MNELQLLKSIFQQFSRYIAVHYPLRRIYLQKSRRAFKYIFSVILLSSLFTITRFFEAELAYEDQLDENDNGKVSNKTVLYLRPTELRLDPIYIKYYNWSRLIAYGLVPFVMLVYLNGLMYQEIKGRRKNWLYQDNNGQEIATTEAIILNGTTTDIVDVSEEELQNHCCITTSKETEKSRLVH